jgi:hypothetical protein
MNLTPGGLLGYASSKCITSLNVPSSNGVSAGPIITAFLICINKVYAVVVCGVAVPGHNIVSDRRGGDSGRRIVLHSLQRWNISLSINYP